MTLEELKNFTQTLFEMVANDSQAEASKILTSISEGFESLETQINELTTAKSQLTENNEKLRAVNADLFLKVGNKEKPEEKADTFDNDNVPSFDSLFNEKGELI